MRRLSHTLLWTLNFECRNFCEKIINLGSDYNASKHYCEILILHIFWVKTSKCLFWCNMIQKVSLWWKENHSSMQSYSTVDNGDSLFGWLCGHFCKSDPNPFFQYSKSYYLWNFDHPLGFFWNFSSVNVCTHLNDQILHVLDDIKKQNLQGKDCYCCNFNHRHGKML